MALRHSFVGTIKFQTGKAILFQDHFWEGPEWMPKSQILSTADPSNPQELHIQASQWICSAKGISEFTHINNAEEEEEVSDEDEIIAIEGMMQIRREVNG